MFVCFSPCRTDLWIIIIIIIDPSESQWSEACPRAAMFSRDVTKREVSSLFSVVAGCGAVREVRGPTLPLRFFLLFFLADHGRVSKTTPNLSRTFPEPSRRCFSSLAFPWWLNRTCASLLPPLPPPVCCCLLVNRNVFPPQNVPLAPPRSIFPLLARRLSLVFRFVLDLFWLQVSRAKSDDSAAGFDWPKSRDNCKYTYRGGFSGFGGCRRTPCRFIS